mmetsp:Transcript_14081/g.30077  ORF Transcript_14081/g.30077 Transcript_14081/m.30077 type:complete len:449 (+) Transcript_14081:105-1451(+)
MMDLKLTTAPSVTPHELDAWLRTTEVDDDEKDETPLVPMHPLRMLSSLSSSPSQPPENDESSRGDYGRSVAQQRGYRRRSSLDCKPGSSDGLVDKSFFGIDEITLLSANSNNNYDANNDQAGVEIDAEDWRLVSDTSFLSSIGIGDDNAPLPSNKTCGSTVPDRIGFRRSVSCPHRHGDDENICAAAEGSISPVPMDDSSPGQNYCRSLSLPSERDNGQRSLHDATGDDVAPISPRSPNHHTGRNHHNESVASLADPSHYFISAMERSRVSQDCIQRRFLNNSIQRDMATMRDSAESRALLLRIMLRGRKGGARYCRPCSHRRSSAPDSAANDGGAESRSPPLFRNHPFATRGARGNKRVSGSSGNVHHHDHHQPRRQDAGTRMHNLRQFHSFDDRYLPPKPMLCSRKHRIEKQLQHQHHIGDVKADLQRIALEQMMEMEEEQVGYIN